MNTVTYHDSTAQQKKDLPENFVSSKSEGSGLGLYFIKEAANQLGGHFNIEHKNTTLYFKIIFN